MMMQKHTVGKILLIGAVIYALIMAQFSGEAPRSPFWLLEWVLFGLCAIGLWMPSDAHIKDWAGSRGRRVAIAVYVVGAWLGAMAYELTLTRTGEGVGGNHQETLASFILSQGLYLPLIAGVLFMIWRYRLSVDKVIYLIAGFSLAEGLIFRAFLLSTMLSPHFYFTPFVLSYYVIVYVAILALPLLFMKETVFWSNNATKTMGPIRLIIAGFLISSMISIFWGLVWGPAMESLFGFPPVAEEIYEQS